MFCNRYEARWCGNFRQYKERADLGRVYDKQDGRYLTGGRIMQDIERVSDYLNIRVGRREIDQRANPNGRNRGIQAS